MKKTPSVFSPFRLGFLSRIDNKETQKTQFQRIIKIDLTIDLKQSSISSIKFGSCPKYSVGVKLTLLAPPRLKEPGRISLARSGRGAWLRTQSSWSCSALSCRNLEPERSNSAELVEIFCCALSWEKLKLFCSPSVELKYIMSKITFA